MNLEEKRLKKKKKYFLVIYLERENYFQSIIGVHICVKPSTLPQPLPVASAIESAVVAADC